MLGTFGPSIIVLGPTTTVLAPTITVFGPTTTFVADGAKLSTVPLMVIALPPGTSVWPATIKIEEAPAVITEPPKVIDGAGVIRAIDGCIGNSLLPITIVEALGAREIGVP